jgi:hypothetical protein
MHIHFQQNINEIFVYPTVVLLSTSTFSASNGFIVDSAANSIEYHESFWD